MKEQNNKAGASGLTILTVLFIGLKLTDYIEWSWWWVLSPVWIPIALIVLIFTVVHFMSKQNR